MGEAEAVEEYRRGDHTGRVSRLLAPEPSNRITMSGLVVSAMRADNTTPARERPHPDLAPCEQGEK